MAKRLTMPMSRAQGIMRVVTTIRTMCPMNCFPTLCGMLVEVEDGHLVGVHGDPDNPDCRGFLCIRGQASREIIVNPRRLLAPLVRAQREAGTDKRFVPDGASRTAMES